MFVVGLAALAIVPGGPEAESETATNITSEIFRQGYGLAICTTVLLDTCNLGWKYDRLSLAAKDSIQGFTALLERADQVSDQRGTIRRTSQRRPDRFAESGVLQDGVRGVPTFHLGLISNS